MYHASDTRVRYVHMCTRTSKNGRCKSKLEFAVNVSFKGVPYVKHKIEDKFSD